MGYTTDFWGELTITPALTPEQVKYIQAFNKTRRMKRDPDRLARMYDVDPLVGPTFGIDGEFYVGGEGDFGQDRDDSVVNYNDPPRSQPGLWCQWTVNDEGTQLYWDEGEKFYDYVDWLEYMIEKFFVPWGKKLDGVIDWDGEDSDDRGRIIVQANAVTTKMATFI
jgi:hypothetical protein